MVTKNQIKLIHSLSTKKQRIKNQLVVAEGFKVIEEFLKASYELSDLFTTTPNLYTNYTKKTTLISEADLKKISFLTTPNTSLAIFKIPNKSPQKTSGLTLGLDAINDPGNLGTIIRLCDWFDIKTIICSSDTTDVYNPKVIQSTMGSLARVSVGYTDLTQFLNNYKKPVFGTFMNGDNIYSTPLPSEGIIIMGNEANGISNEIEKLITHKITIPQFGKAETESLNVATATAIILSEFKRTSI